MLGSQGRYVQSAETANINNAGESSILAQLANSMSIAMSELFTFKARWSLGKKGEDAVSITVTLNTDFTENVMDGQFLTSMISALQGGAISPEVFYYNMDRREAYPKDWNFEKEMEALASAGMGTTSAIAEIVDLQDRLAELEDKMGSSEPDDGDQGLGPVNLEDEG